jgi:hypothetical protein
MSDRRCRALLGWVAPIAVDNLYRIGNVTSPDTLQGFRQLCLDARGTKPSGSSLTASGSPPSELVGPGLALALEMLDSPLYKRVYAPMRAVGIRSVPLISLICPQWWIDDEYVDDLAAGLPEQGNDISLFEYCFRRGAIDSPIIQGPLPNRGYFVSFSSRTRSLDAPGVAPTVATVSEDRIDVTFSVDARPNHILVAPIEGTDRLLILNGVHRLFALLRAGRDRAVCVFLPPVNVSQPVFGIDFANNPEFFNAGELLSPQPPYLRHFLDSGHSHPVTVRALIQTMRVALVPDIGFVPSA